MLDRPRDEMDATIVDYLIAHPMRDQLLSQLSERSHQGSALWGTEHIERLHRAAEAYLESDQQRLFHPEKSRQTWRFYQTLSAYTPIGNKVSLDFGCGSHEAFAMSLLFWANGAQSAVAIDPEPLAFPDRTARFLHQWIIELLTYPQFYFWRGQSRDVFCQRLLSIDLGVLKQGDLSGLFRNVPIRYKSSGKALHDLVDGEVDLVFSHSVLEHVADLKGTLQQFYRALRAEGYLCIAVDYRDHRLYVSGESPWQYLLDDGDYQPGYINKVRHYAFVDLLLTSGFRIVNETLTEEAVPSSVGEQRLPKYQELSYRDLGIVASYLIAQKR